MSTERMTITRARTILEAWCLQEGAKLEGMTLGEGKSANEEAVAREWWMSGDEPMDDPESPRNRAHFAAYVAIAGPRFYAKGIPVHDRRVHPDKAIMRTLLEHNYVEIIDEKFVPTAKGESLLAAMSVPDVG